MEILYIHIKSNNKIENQDINFGGKFHFEYNHETCELVISENHLYIENFYSFNNRFPKGAEILNVSSIIGANGVGKSSILDLIRKNFSSGYNGIRDELIFAIRNEKNIILHHVESIKIKKHNCEEFGVKLNKLKAEDLFEDPDEPVSAPLITIPPRIRDFEHTDFVYFSNIFDDKSESEIKGTANISTNYLVRNDYAKKTEMGTIDHNYDKRQLDHYKFEEIRRQIAFISGIGFHKNLIPFTLPDAINLSLSNNMLLNSFQLDERVKKNLIENDLFEDFNIIQQRFKNFILNNGDINQKLITEIIINAFLGFIIDIFSFRFFKKEFKSFSQEIQILIEKETEILSIFNSTKNALNKFVVNIPDNYHEVLDSIIKMNQILSTFKNLTSQFENSFFSREASILNIDISKTNIEKFTELYSIYVKTYQLRPYLNFHWRSLSSGEKAFLNLYSRFYSLTNEEQFDDGLEKNLIILMDEADVYLHPQWQKNLLNLLLEFFTVAFDKTTNGQKRNIQVIFTTNSPIPASDLLSSNTIFLKNENDKTIVKDGLSDQRQTFAANIHTLFSDSFFIEGGLIGDFASKKINSIIKQLNSLQTLSLSERETMRKTIMQIGEPIIKTKLIQIYNDRFNMEIHERLEKLEKNNKSDDQD